MQTSWEPVDPAVTDPVRQDNDKRNNIQMYTENLYSSTQEGGDKTSQYSYLVVILSNWVCNNWVRVGLPFAELGELQKQVDLQGVFVKIGDFKINLIRFSCGIPREQKAILRKSKPPENRQKSGLF